MHGDGNANTFYRWYGIGTTSAEIIPFSEFFLFSIAFASLDVDLTLFFRSKPLCLNGAGRERSKELKRLPALNRENFPKQSLDGVTTQLYSLVGNHFLEEYIRG
jgi:hypothetical protein